MRAMRTGILRIGMSPKPVSSRASMTRSLRGRAQQNSAMPRASSSGGNAEVVCGPCTTLPSTSLPRHEPQAPFLQL